MHQENHFTQWDCDRCQRSRASFCMVLIGQIWRILTVPFYNRYFICNFLIFTRKILLVLFL